MEGPWRYELFQIFSYFFSLMLYFSGNYSKILLNKQSEDLYGKSGAGGYQQLRPENLFAQGISRDSVSVHYARQFISGVVSISIVLT